MSSTWYKLHLSSQEVKKSLKKEENGNYYFILIHIYLVLTKHILKTFIKYFDSCATLADHITHPANEICI